MFRILCSFSTIEVHGNQFKQQLTHAMKNSPNFRKSRRNWIGYLRGFCANHIHIWSIVCMCPWPWLCAVLCAVLCVCRVCGGACMSPHHACYVLPCHSTSQCISHHTIAAAALLRYCGLCICIVLIWKHCIHRRIEWKYNVFIYFFLLFIMYITL